MNLHVGYDLPLVPVEVRGEIVCHTQRHPDSDSGHQSTGWPPILVAHTAKISRFKAITPSFTRFPAGCLNHCLEGLGPAMSSLLVKAPLRSGCRSGFGRSHKNLRRGRVNLNAPAHDGLGMVHLRAEGRLEAL